MKVQSKMKPCPFCGSTRTTENNTYDHWKMFMVYYRVCIKCGARTGNCKTSDEATAAWNRRADDE